MRTKKSLRRFWLRLNMMALVLFTISPFVFRQGPGRMTLAVIGVLEMLVMSALVVSARLSGKTWHRAIGR